MIGHQSQGLSLIELLAAVAIVAIAMVALLTVRSEAINRAIYTKNLYVAENHLSDLYSETVTDEDLTVGTEEEELSADGFSYEREVEKIEINEIEFYRITLTVFFPTADKEDSISITTLLQIKPKKEEQTDAQIQ